MRGCYCENNSILCIYDILTFLYLVSFKQVVTVSLIVSSDLFYIPSGICLLRVGSGGAGASCVMCFWFAVNTP